MVEEIFKDISGYEGIYKVSNLGRVLSLARINAVGRGATGIKQRILKQEIEPSGRISVGLCKNGRRKTCKVYNLVAAAFPDNITVGRRVNDRVLANLYFDVRKRKWSARILVNEKIVLFGSFNSKIEAYNAYISNAPKSEATDYYGNDRNKTSKYMGVCWNKSNNKWRASISKNKTRIHIGYFDTEEEARDAYICKK